MLEAVGGPVKGNDGVLDVVASGKYSKVNPADPPLEAHPHNKATDTDSFSNLQNSGEPRHIQNLPAEVTVGPQGGTSDNELRWGSSSQRAIPDKPERERSPPVLAPISTTVDPQSSPASSNGAGSTNTPDAAAGSPTTSPGDEHVPEVLTSIGHDASIAVSFDLSKSTDPIPPSFPLSKSPDDSAAMPPPTEAGHDPVFQQRLTSAGRSADVSNPVPATGRKPNMRIDTRAVTITIPDNRARDLHLMESPISLNSAFTPRRLQSSASFSAGQSPPGRVTRITSGTIRHRSVSEILGERPKPPSPPVAKSLTPNSIPILAREAFEASSLQSRLVDRKEREKDRSKLSTVVFAKPQRALDLADSSELLRKVSRDVTPFTFEERDYLHTLFEARAYSPPRGQSLNTLLQSAHKTLSTADHLVDYQEQMSCRTLKRIYQLQNANRWSLRQMSRAPEPVRQTSHWDFLLDHAKWMRTDFREERKWKVAAARGLAEWCAEWMSGTPRRRQQLQIKVRPLQPRLHKVKDGDLLMDDGFEDASPSAQQTPDLVASAENESIADDFVDEMMDLRFSAAPAAIFSLGASDFSFPMSKTPATDKLLSELPFYKPVDVEPDLSQSDLAERSDSKWKTDIIPVSRFATEKILYRPPKAPLKRSRYDYEEERPPSKDSKPLPPEQTNVALFMPENKHIRDRIHPGHSFRPPSEYTMPAQAFFESRASSQWTQNEDDDLRRLVKDYSYNWSLISSCLSTRSPFHSGADRRTPWECFERWINLEGLPADMSKTPYFRAYHSRIEAAGRHVIAQQEAAQRQAGGNPALTARKRTTQPVRVERKKNQRHLAMLDAMRKLAKKRETALQKQQHGKMSSHAHGCPFILLYYRMLYQSFFANNCTAADLAAMRKANEADRPRPPFSTPAEFSRLKHEREVKLAERQEIYRLQVLAQQKVLKLLPGFHF